MRFRLLAVNLSGLLALNAGVAAAGRERPMEPTEVNANRFAQLGGGTIALTALGA
jgi:hypothetical protein